MANIRVISDNAIDRTTPSASTQVAGFLATNLQLLRKSDVWRASGTSARLSAAWATAEPIQAVALPFCNLSPTATMRVRATSETQATNLLTNPNAPNAGGWGNSTIQTIATGLPGPDGTNSASTITATAAGATCYQTVGVSAGTYAASIWIRRRTGTGTVSMRDIANSVWNPVAVSSSWARFSTAGAVAASAILSLQLGTSGDAIDIAFGQVEAGGVVTSYYPGTRPLGYIDSWQGYTYDSGAQLACPAPAVKLRGFTATQAASAYAFGGGAHARHWMPASVGAYGLAVDIVDTASLQGYIEAAFLVAGPLWEAEKNFDYNANAQPIDSSKNSRNDAGDLISDPGTVSQKLTVPMSKLSPGDRATLWGILRSSGIRYPLFVSMFPGSSDLTLERDHQTYGKFVQLPAMALPFFNIASTTIEIESV